MSCLAFAFVFQGKRTCFLSHCNWTRVQNSPPVRPTEATEQFHFVACQTTLLAIHQCIASNTDTYRYIQIHNEPDKKGNRSQWIDQRGQINKFVSRKLSMRPRCCKSSKNQRAVSLFDLVFVPNWLVSQSQLEAIHPCSIYDKKEWPAVSTWSLLSLHGVLSFALYIWHHMTFSDHLWPFQGT